MRRLSKGASPLLMIFLIIVLAVGSFFIYRNYAVNLKSGASSVVQSANGTLLKKGSAAFITACGKTPTSFTYALTGGTQVLGLEVEAATAPSGFSTSPVLTRPPTYTIKPSPTPIRQTSPPRTIGPTAVPVPTYNPSVCLPLSITASLADPLVGQKVVVTGTYQKNIFYATTIKKLSACVEQCPGKDNVLRNCHPAEIDGSSADSQCNKAGRVEFCGTKNFCCPVAGGRWTTDMTRCATPKPPVSPTPSPYIHVSVPNGGETYGRGQTVQLAWQSGGISNVSIYVVNANGVPSLINGLQSNPTGVTNYFNWVANPPNFIYDPNTSVNSYTIKITDSSGKYADSSDSYFKIVPNPTPTAKATSTPVAGKIFNGAYLRMYATCTGSNKLFNITASGNMPTYGGSGNGYWVVFNSPAQTITYSYQDQSSTQIGVQSYNSQFTSTRNEGTMYLTGDNTSYSMNICYEPYTTGIPSCSNIVDKVNFSMSCP